MYPVRSSSDIGLAQGSLCCAVLFFLAAAEAGPAAYNLTSDWSDAQNPNGAWSYNQNQAPITEFQTFWWGQAGWGYNWLGDGGILRGTSPAGMTDPFGSVVPPAHDWQPGDVMLHALSVPYGGTSTFLNVTWTSPATGRIDIDGRAWDGQIYPDRDVGWSFTVGGEIFAQRSSVRGLYRTNEEAQLTSNLVGAHTLTGVPVTQGEVVEFRVAAQTFYGQFVGLELNIVPGQPFLPRPVLSLAPMSVLSFTNLAVGGTYQLQRWVAWYWSNQPVSFAALDLSRTQLVAGVVGPGDYRLALSPVPAQAFATAELVNGFVVGASVTSGGSGYLTTPAVTIVGGGGSNAMALAQISGGVVTKLQITSAGIGYTNTPTIRIAPPPAAAVVPSMITPVMRLDSSSLDPAITYKVQYQPDLAAGWTDWNGALFSPVGTTNSQLLYITNAAGFFRLLSVP